MPDQTLHHRFRAMTGRDPHDAHRAATPLELLFDLAFVVAFGTAANELAHFFAEDHVVDGVIAYAFVCFGITWAWINFTWFASAYDTDDWLYRLTTMLQMVGVMIFALGIGPMFTSIEHGEALDIDVIVLGYVVMRVAMLAQWVRAHRQDPTRRLTHRTYLVAVVTAQVLWCALALTDFSIGTTFALMIVPFVFEVGGPVVAEIRGEGTPWHAHHVAERYGLLVIITLGEGMIGTMVVLSAMTSEGLTLDVALLAFAGTALTFGIWWVYFAIPHGEILHARRERAFVWGYGHIPIYGAIAAIGAGMHAAAYLLEDHTELSLVGTVLTVVVPVAVVLGLIYAFYALVGHVLDPFHLLLLAGSAAVIAVSVAMAAADVSLVWCLLVLAATPWVTVLGYETVGHRHTAQLLDRIRN